MIRKLSVFIVLVAFQVLLAAPFSHAFRIWTPRSQSFIDPKYAVMDTPKDQFDWAMELFEQGDFEQAAREFRSLVYHYVDSEYAPDAQYYSGRATEEAGKYYRAFKEYQKTIDLYPFSDRIEDIVRRQYFIAQMFQKKDTPRIMELELSFSLDRAVEIYQNVIDNMPYGEYAEKALFEKASCYRRMRKHSEAIGVYDRLITDYPNSSLVPEARYQLAFAKYEASLESDYDQRLTREALEAFERLKETGISREKIEKIERAELELQERKATSQLDVADFYFRQRRYDSALMYLKRVVENYPQTQSAEKAQEQIDRIQERAGK